jgi:hypothetical protein
MCCTTRCCGIARPSPTAGCWSWTASSTKRRNICVGPKSFARRFSRCSGLQPNLPSHAEAIQLREITIRRGRLQLPARRDHPLRLQLALRCAGQRPGLHRQRPGCGPRADRVQVHVGRRRQRAVPGGESLSAGSIRRSRLAFVLHGEPAQSAWSLSQRRHLALHRRHVGAIHPPAGPLRGRLPRVAETRPTGSTALGKNQEWEFNEWFHSRDGPPDGQVPPFKPGPPRCFLHPLRWLLQLDRFKSDLGEDVERPCNGIVTVLPPIRHAFARLWAECAFDVAP